MQTIHILSGIPASGKSTWAREYAAQQHGVLHLSRDEYRKDLRESIDSTEYFPVSAAEEWKGWTEAINYAINKGFSIIIDQTTLGEGALVKLLKALDLTTDINIVVHAFPISLEEAQFRNGFREGFEYVPPETIQNMFKAAFKSLSASTVRRLLVQAEQPLIGVEVVVHR